MNSRAATVAIAGLLLVSSTGCTKPALGHQPLQEMVDSAQTDDRALSACASSISFDAPTDVIAAVDSSAGEIRAFRDEVDVWSPDFDRGLPSDDSTYAAICIYEYNPFPDKDLTYEADWVSLDDSGSGGQGVIAHW